MRSTSIIVHAESRPPHDYLHPTFQHSIISTRGLSAEVHVVRNGCFGDESQFELYNESEMRQRVEGNGGKSVTFPDLADRVADDLYTKRLALSTAAKVLPTGNRAELGRWRGEVRKVLLQLVA
jgi:hypothetical protein